MYFIFAIAFLVVLLIFTVSTYNSLITRKNQVENAEGSVNVALKKRHELIPNLTACVQYDHEQQQLRLEKLSDITKAINTGEFSEQRMMQEGELATITASVMSEAVESQNDSIMHLQRVWTEMEEQISAARRFYNTSISRYNTSIESFPGNLMANALKLEKKEKFDIPLSQKFVTKNQIGHPKE